MVAQKRVVISKKKIFLEQISKKCFLKNLSFALKSTLRKFQNDTPTVEKVFMHRGGPLTLVVYEIGTEYTVNAANPIKVPYINNCAS